MTKVTRGEICDYIGYTRKFLDYSENEEARFVEDIWVVNAENATITAISGIWAKNIIDVLVEVSPGGKTKAE